MPSTAIEARSISAELVLLFTVAAAVLLSAGLGILYWLVVQHAVAEDNAVLADKVSAVRAQLENAGGAGALDQELKTSQAGDRITYWVRVIDSSGSSVAKTPGIDAILGEASVAERSGNVATYRRDGKMLAVVSLNQTVGGQNYTIEVAQDRSADEEFTKHFGLLLGGVLVGGIAVSAVIARIVTKRGLRPLAEMTRSFERIGAEHLHERVPPTGWPRELRPLALAFAEMLERLEGSFRRLSQFSADLAHELRTPIANLRGEAEVALTRPRSADEYRAVLESNVAECERLAGVIDKMLFLARADAAEGQLDRICFDGRASLEKIVGFYQTMAEEREVKIACAGKGEVFADPVLFGRAVSNLLDNALRFTPRGGRIAIAVAKRNAHCEVSVADNGPGIPSAHLPHVFDRFYRADSSRSSQGTGLGLALVKSISELHGGTAEVRSVAGHGTTVTLVFPEQLTRAPEA